MDAYLLYTRYSQEELVAKRKALCDDPKNESRPGMLCLYNKKTKRKLDAIDWAIFYHLQNRRKDVGEKQ